MGDEYLVHILGRLSSIWLNAGLFRANLVFSGPVSVFYWVSWGDLDRNPESSAPGVYHSL